MNYKCLAALFCAVLCLSSFPAAACEEAPAGRDPELGEYQASVRWPGWYCADYLDGRNESSWFSKPPGDRYLSVHDGTCAHWEKQP